jgi:hypothetical protein
VIQRNTLWLLLSFFIAFVALQAWMWRRKQQLNDTPASEITPSPWQPLRVPSSTRLK